MYQATIGKVDSLRDQRERSQVHTAAEGRGTRTRTSTAWSDIGDGDDWPWEHDRKYEHELALFKQHKFGSKNEHLTAKQIHLWDEAVEEDIAAVDQDPRMEGREMSLILRPCS